VKFPDLGALWDRVLAAARRRGRFVAPVARAKRRSIDVNGGERAAALS
jgi:membrane protein